MKDARVQTRWLLSFSDLVLLLLAFFVLLHAQRGNPDAVVSSIGDAFDSGHRVLPIERRLSARELFVPGEAVLRDPPRSGLLAQAREWSVRGGQVLITSVGRDGDSTRFDRWELAAARAAALAGLLRQGGIPADDIVIAMPPARGRETGDGQRLIVRFQPRR